MQVINRILVVSVVMVVGGCAARGPGGGVAAEPAATQPVTTQPVAERGKAELRLDEIEPVLQLPAPRRVRAGEPPLESIELFAQARGLLDRRPREAVGLLERAILLDQESYELYYSLGEAHLNANSAGDQSLEAFERAVELRPTSIEARLQLARQYMSKSRLERALTHLRLARMSPEYARESEDSVLVDLLLARVLQQEGYDRAALEQYERTLARVLRPAPLVRRNPELMFLISRPELLELQVAELAEKLGDREQAIAALRRALAGDPHEFELHARLLRALAGTGDVEETRKASLELVRRFRASDQSMKLLREVYQQLGRGDELVGDLRQLYAAHPSDKLILLALVDVLQEQGQTEQAEQLLAAWMESAPADVEVLRRLVVSLDRRDAVLEAARRLIDAAAAEPASIRSTADLWASLLQPGRRVRLKLSDVRRMEIAAEAEAARQYWVSRLAEMWNRETLAREALQRSVEAEGVFPPSYRMLLLSVWRRPDYQETTKVEQSQALIQRAAAKGDTALAEELKGLLALQQQQGEQSVRHLEAAMAVGAPSPELQLNYADAMLLLGNVGAAEQALWRMVGDWPRFGEAYEKLFGLYVARRQPQQAIRVLETWLSNDPTSVEGRLLRAVLLAQTRQLQAAEQLLLQLFEEAGDNEQVLGSLQALYVQSGREAQWVQLLEREQAKRPDNHQVVALLSQAYVRQKRTEDAIKLLDGARTQAAGEPDLLYFLAHLYSQAGQKETASTVLEEVIALDPTHASAANDLGYSWADAGIHLDRAEALIRLAVAEEPDNQAFLDSLAWVLYKRSKFEEARQYLDQALSSALRPDPIVIDHLGDTLYQLGRKEEAVEQWQRAMDMLAGGRAQRADLVELRVSLTRKLRAVERNEAAPVAPVVEQRSAPVEARSGDETFNK